MWAFIIAHFQEDQTKYQPSQTHMCIYMYIYIKKRSTPTSQQLDEISAVHTAVCQFREIIHWKNGKNLCTKKKIFICIKSVLKNPCNKLTLRSSNKAEIQNQNHSVSETNSWASILFTPLLNSQQYPVPYLPIRTSKVSSLEQSPSQENVANH